MHAITGRKYIDDISARLLQKACFSYMSLHACRASQWEYKERSKIEALQLKNAGAAATTSTRTTQKTSENMSLYWTSVQ